MMVGRRDGKPLDVRKMSLFQVGRRYEHTSEVMYAFGILDAAGADVCLVGDDVRMLFCVSKQKLQAWIVFS